MNQNIGLKYRPGKTITLDPVTLQYVKENPQGLNNGRSGFLYRVNICLEWMQQWSVKVVVVLYVIILFMVLYWRWASDPNLLKVDRYLTIGFKPDTITPFPAISAFSVPAIFLSSFDFDTAMNLVDTSSVRIRISEGYMGKSTPSKTELPLDLFHWNRPFIYEALLSATDLIETAESKLVLRVTGTKPTVEIMQYHHGRVRFDQLIGSTEFLIWNSSCIAACYPHSFVGPMAGECRINYTNATRAEFPLFGKLLDTDIRPYSVRLQPGQSLELPALWMYELRTLSRSASFVRKFSDIQLSLIDALVSRNPLHTEVFVWSDDRLIPALALFLSHLERRLSFPNLTSNLVQTRFPLKTNSSELSLTSCNADGLLSNSLTVAQFVRKQASTLADAILKLERPQQQLATQDYLEKMLTIILHPRASAESFLRKYLDICSNN